MSKKRLIITSIISIVLVSVLMLGSTYSIFTTGSVDENLNVYKTGVLEVNYTLSSDNISFTDYIPTSNEDSIKLTPYRITVTNDGTVPYMFNVILEDVTATESIDSKYIMTQVGKFEPKKLSDGKVLDNDNYYVVKEDVILPANSSVDIDIRIWVSDEVKNTEVDKSFNSKLVVDGLAVYNKNTNIDNSFLKADIMEPITKHIIDLYNDGSNLKTVNIGGDTTKPTVKQNTTQEIMLDNNGEYRYYGANPDNYVEFNGELWRIISVSNVKDDKNDTTGSMRVKIIRDESIGTYSWDSSASTINSGAGVNDWSQADLMTELNDLYYNKKSGTCYNSQNNASTTCDFTTIGLKKEARKMIDDALWYLGGSLTYEGLYSNDYYNFERGNVVFGSTNDGQICSDGACPRNTTWTGKIGLMYPSDYMYATDLKICTQNGWQYNDNNCYVNNWLLNTSIDSAQWTISQNASLSNSIFVIYNDSHGNVGHNLTSNQYGVLPVIYLRSDTMFYGGDGSKIKPYKLHVENDYLSNHVIDLYNDGSELKTVNIAGDTTKPTVTQNTKKGLMLDNNGEYRYYGANPDNYVEFNGELWRIISVSNVKDDINDEIGSMRVKIIKNESLGTYSWDSSESTINSGYGVNDWTKSDINTELNDLYYNKKSGACYNDVNNASTSCDFTNTGLNDTAKNLLDDALWYLGGISSIFDKYPNDYYDFERGTAVYNCETDDGACPRATNWSGKIGLMYPSDYMYATDLSKCTVVGLANSNNDYRIDVCAKNNWLNNGMWRWMITPLSTLAYDVFHVGVTGYISTTKGYGLGHINPTIYLRNNVVLAGGTGTISDPYIVDHP